MQRPLFQIAVLSASVLLVAAAPGGAAAQAVTPLAVPGAVAGVEQRAPAAAFDGASHLLAWEESDVVWAAVVGAAGALEAGPFPVAPSAEPLARQATPAVAAAASGGGFLVVWAEDADGSGDWDVRGARVSSAGDVIDATGFDVSVAAGPQELPAVASSGSEFLVVWQDGRTDAGAPDVLGTLVIGGVVSAAGETAISSGTGAARRPAVAASGTGYLVAWEEDPGSGVAAVVAAQVAADTGAASAPFALSATAGDQRLPSVASSGSGFAVAWNEQRSGSWELGVARVDAAGVLDVGGVPVAGVDGAGAPHAIASDGSGYLLAWGGSASGAFGRRFGADGVPGVELPIDGAAVLPPGQALSFGGLGRYLLVHRIDAAGTPQLGAWLVTTLEQLDVVRAGTGSGSVTSSPRGIDCGATCSASFATGSQVLLTALADAGSVLEGWTGCAVASASTCTVTASGAVTVTATFHDVPAAPGGPTYADLGPTSLTASWTAADGATAHELERAPDTASGPGPYALVATISGTSHGDTSLAPNGTYWYRVRGTNAAGAGSYGTETSVTTLPGVPGTPTLSGTTAESVTLAWSAPDGGATGYELERATSAGTDWAPVGGVVGLGHVDAGLAPATEYLYRVRATNGAGAGAYSGTASVTTLPLPPEAPAPPAFTDVAATSVTATWGAVTGATRYDLERAPSDAGPWTLVAGGLAGTSHPDLSLSPNTKYWYRVRAANTGGESASSAASSVITFPAAPGTPMFGAVTATSVTVSWGAPAGGAATYAIERAPSATGPWTQLATNLAELGYTDSGLTAGTTYWYRVLASNPSGAGAPSGSASVATLPPAAGAPEFTSVTASSLTVTWSPVTGATSYAVERAPAQTGEWTQLAAGLAALAHPDSGLAGGTTYWYRVLASNDSGPGEYSSAASVVTLPLAPGAPTFADVTASSLTVSWSPVSGATGYELERAPAAGGVPGTWAPVKTVAATSWNDSGLGANATYWYRVRAWNASGGGAYSEERSVLTAVATPGAPVPSAVSTTGLTLSWAAPAGGAAAYSVERAPAATGAWTELASGLVGLTFTDSGLAAGTTYWYRVLARNGSGDAYSASAQVATLPAAPGPLTFTNVAASSLTVSWPPVTGATSYKVERAPDVGGAAGSWTQLAQGVTATSQGDTGRIGNTVYWYRVRATNASGDGAYSPHASVLTLPGAPGTPSFGAITATSLTVSWAAPSGGAASYALERTTIATGTWTVLDAGLTAPTYPDAGLSPGTTYGYRVRAANAAGTGLYSATAWVPTIPDAPGALTFTDVTAATLTLSWPPVTGATSYKVERAPDVGGSAGTYTQIAQGVTGTSHGDTGRAPNATYWYRVRAWNASGDGAYSPGASALTRPGVPGTPRFASVTDASVTVSWTAPAGGADVYDLERATSALGPWALVASGTAALEYEDASLDPGVKYWYRVRGVNATGPGLWSTISSLTSLPDTTAAPWFTGVSTVSLTANWTPTAGATTYHVERALDVSGAPGSWEPVASGLGDPYFNDAVAPNTTYWYRVRGGNTAGFGGWSLPGSVATLANEPGGAPTFANVTDTSLTVSWGAPAGGAASYVVERATSALGPWAVVASGVAALAYDDLALSPETTYWYRIRSTTSGGATGAPSGIAAVMTLSARPGDAPGTPTFAGVGASSVAVAWAAAADATSYQLERAPDAGGAPGAWLQVASPATTSHTDAGVGPNTSYWYRVRAVNAGGAGPYSGASRVVTLPDVPGIPAFEAVLATTVTVSWAAPAGGAVSYVVERATSARPWAAVAPGGLGATTFTDTGLTPSTVYYYRVRGANALGQPGAASPVGAVTTPPDESTPPGTPGTPTYSSVSATALTISWSPAAGAESHALDRAPDASGSPGTWTQLAAALTVATYRDAGRAANTVYWYRVRASGAAGDTVSTASPVMTAPSAPGAPAFGSVTATALAVSWSAPAGGAATYEVERAPSAIGPWMQLRAGMAATVLDDAGLTGNTTYHYRIRATNAAGLEGPYSASRSVTTLADATTPLPGAPGTPAYPTIAATYLEVTWAPAADATSYLVERASAEAGPWAQLAATSAGRFTDTGRTANTTYWYRVRASNGRGEGPYSPASSATTAPNAPGAPSFSSVAATTLTVSWTASAGGATSYVLERATSVVGPWTAVRGITALSWADSGLSPYTTYYYRVRATNSAGLDGSSSGSRSVLTAADPAVALPGPPGVPTYSSVTATYVKVSWAPATNAIGYELERAAAAGGPWTPVAATGATSLTDPGRTPNTAYWYRVRATNGAGTGPYSPASSVVTAPGAPGTPTFSAVSATTLTVAWTAPAGGAASYVLERATSAVGPWSGVRGLTATSHGDTGLSAYTTYYYRVRATNPAGLDGAASATSSVLTAAGPSAPPGAPGAPTYSSVTAASVSVSWASASATSYELERATGTTGTWTRIATVGATSFTDAGRTANTAYWYRVRGVNGGGPGVYSPASGVVTAPNAPGAPELSSVTSTTLTVSWAAPAGGAASYVLERASSPVGPWGVVASGLGVQTFADSGLAAYTTYYYRVRGTNSAGLDGLASYTAWVTTEPASGAPPGAPGTPTFSSVNATWVKVSWAAAAEATGYVLERASASGGPWTFVATQATTSFSDTGRAANTRYWYRVAGTNGGGAGAWSEASSVVTAPNAPGAPAFSAIEATTVTVSWTAPAGGAARYAVERATTSIGPWVELAPAVMGLDHVDSGLTPGTAYHYRVRATNEDGTTGAYSVVRSVTTAPPPGA